MGLCGILTGESSIPSCFHVIFLHCDVKTKANQQLSQGSLNHSDKEATAAWNTRAPSTDGGRRDSGFQTRLMLAPEHTNVFLKTAVANTQDYKQIFSQLHPFMLYIKAVFTEGHTVVVFVQGQLCFSLRKQAREGVNKRREWGCRLAEPSL